MTSEPSVLPTVVFALGLAALGWGMFQVWRAESLLKRAKVSFVARALSGGLFGLVFLALGHLWAELAAGADAGVGGLGLLAAALADLGAALRGGAGARPAQGFAIFVMGMGVIWATLAELRLAWVRAVMARREAGA